MLIDNYIVLILLAGIWGLGCAFAARLVFKARATGKQLLVALQLAQDRVSQLKAETTSLERRVEVSERRNAEYFDLIERICAQRDHRWRMFLDQSHGHLQAQALLEKSLSFTRQLLAKAVLQLNAMRREMRLPEVNSPEVLLGLDAPPMGTAVKFEQAIEKIKQDMDEPIDGPVERDRIKGET
jgi:hypothetical protein